MTHYDFINELVGIPFVENGRDRDGLDCYGLILLFARERFDVELPDWMHDFTAKAVVEQMTYELEESVDNEVIVEIPDPEEWCIITVNRKHMPYHMGLAVGNGVLHASRASKGVIFQSMSQFQMDNPASSMRYWQWLPS